MSARLPKHSFYSAFVFFCLADFFLTQCHAWQEIDRLVSGDIGAADQFGTAVALQSGLALIGVDMDDDNGLESGAAYLFQDAGGGSWSQLPKLTASDGAASDQFGVSVALDGNTALIGAIGDNGNAGSTYVFRDSGGWGEIDKLTAGDAQANDQFGTSVSLSGDFAIVGAPAGDSSTIADAGSAYIFQDTGTWNEVTELNASDVLSESGFASQFGLSVAVDGDRALVGAPKGDATLFNDTGAAYLFEKDGLGNWGEIAKLTASDGLPFDDFGFSVALQGDVAVVGAPFGGGPGAAYVFQDDGLGNWNEIERLSASDATLLDFDQFGWSVALDDNKALIGAYFDSDDGLGSGSAYLFEDDGSGNWSEIEKLTASDAVAGDQFGDAVALDANLALVGAIFSAGTGAAYLFETFSDADFNEDGEVNSLDLGLWETGYGTATGADKIDGDANGDGAVDGRDFLIWQSQYTGTNSVVTVSQVPEPGSSMLNAAFILMASCIRLRRSSIKVLQPT